MRKRRLIRRVILGTAAFLGLAGLLLGGNTARNVARLQPLTDTPAERLAELRPAWQLMTPKTPGPWPAMILLSGCDGIHDNMQRWAAEAVKQGRAALILDSHGPRGLDQMQSWRAVCAGQVLPGAERAGDIAVAMAALAQMPDIQKDNIGILGASHGGWSAMEFLELLQGTTPPPGLTEWPAAPESLAGRIGPVVLLYPYCGMISGAGDGRWPAQVRGLMILGSRDSIIDSDKCRTMAGQLRSNGASLEVVTLSGADHGFDQSERSVLSALEFDPALTATATVLIQKLLATFPAPQPTI